MKTNSAELMSNLWRNTNMSFSNDNSINQTQKIIKKNTNEGRWTADEHDKFISEILRIGIHNWKKVIHVLIPDLV